MPHNIELIIALAVPLVVLMVLRINAAVVFLSLSMGYVLVQLVANDANSLVSFLAPQAGSLSRTTWQLGMLFLPVVLTCIIMAFSVKGRTQTILNLLPAAAVSITAVLMAVPLFTPGLQYGIESSVLWSSLSSAQAMIIGAGALISLIFLWSSRHALEGGSHRKRR